MNQEPVMYDMLWITSEICYYLGLALSVFIVPAFTFALWSMSFAELVDPNYWYILIAWVFSVLMFLFGVAIKSGLYSRNKR